MRPRRFTIDADTATSAPTDAPEATGRRELRDAKAFRPSTFGSRKVARAGEPARPRRLLSLGEQETLIPSLGSRGPQVRRFEAFVDMDDSGTVWIREPHDDTLQPLVRHSGEAEKVVPLEPMRSRPRVTTDTFPAGQDDRVEMPEPLPW
jgi:hypothetical protein